MDVSKLCEQNQDYRYEIVDLREQILKLESNNQLEDYVMTIGDAREVVKGNLPEWVVSDYKNKK